MSPIPSKPQLMELLAHSVSTHYADFTAAAADLGLTSSQAKTLSVLRRAPALLDAEPRQRDARDERDRYTFRCVCSCNQLL